MMTYHFLLISIIIRFILDVQSQANFHFNNDFRSPIMSGGLLALRRDYFKLLGEYDTDMQIWGCENIELSVRAWLCGGSVYVTPCSRIGHLFRVRRPYKSRTDLDTNLFNCLRTVKVWFDEYEEFFYKQRPKAKELDAGDLTERLDIKRRLKCKKFEWYLEEVYPELRLDIPHEEL